MRLRVNDMVVVTKGKDRGKRGRITRVDSKRNRAAVEGVNVMKRHQKPQGAFQQGGIIEKEMPVPVANLAFFDERIDSVSRIGYSHLPDGTKVRICKKSGEVIE